LGGTSSRTSSTQLRDLISRRSSSGELSRWANELVDETVQEYEVDGPPSPLTRLGKGPSSVPWAFFGNHNQLESVLRSAFPGSAQRQRDSSGPDTRAILAEILGLSGGIDSLVEIALGDSSQFEKQPQDDASPVESILFTVRLDASHGQESRALIDVDVIREEAFAGQPSVQIRFADEGSQQSAEDNRSAETHARMPLGYRPSWTPTLVRTPEQLAEQMRIRWCGALGELRSGGDPRMSTFLAGMPRQESAVAILNSTQTPASKFILLQGLLDPTGPIQFEGLDLDASTFSDQINAAVEEDQNAISWLCSVQEEGALTSLAEVTGSSIAAELDFNLSAWRDQGAKLIDTVTMRWEQAAPEISMFRTSEILQAKNRETYERLRQQLSALSSERELTRGSLSRFLELIEPEHRDASSKTGFFEETRVYLNARLNHAIPGLFIARSWIKRRITTSKVGSFRLLRH
jgi:hypothetical protein